MSLDKFSRLLKEFPLTRGAGDCLPLMNYLGFDRITKGICQEYAKKVQGVKTLDDIITILIEVDTKYKSQYARPHTEQETQEIAQKVYKRLTELGHFENIKQREAFLEEEDEEDEREEEFVELITNELIKKENPFLGVKQKELPDTIKLLKDDVRSQKSLARLINTRRSSPANGDTTFLRESTIRKIKEEYLIKTKREAVTLYNEIFGDVYGQAVTDDVIYNSIAYALVKETSPGFAGLIVEEKILRRDYIVKLALDGNLEELKHSYKAFLAPHLNLLWELVSAEKVTGKIEITKLYHRIRFEEADIAIPDENGPIAPQPPSPVVQAPVRQPIAPGNKCESGSSSCI